MFCKYCGTQIADCDKFCPKCGNQIIESTPEHINAIPAPMFSGKKRGILIGVIAVFLCIIVMLAIKFFIKSPEEILKDNEWYGELHVNCDYYDWSTIGSGKGYWISANCIKIIFYHYGEAETTSYSIGGNGGVYGPYSYEITSENVPASAPWSKVVWDDTDEWEIIDKDTLKYVGEYYLWDEGKDTHCDCDYYACKHNKTWYITKEYLRIGRKTYTSKKPTSLYIDD